MLSIIKNPRIVLLSFLFPWFASCVSTKEIPLGNPQVIAGKSAVKSERDKPDFTAVTAGKATGAAFGVIGGAIAGAAMTSSGNAIVNENGVEDPANWISQELLSSMQRKYGVKNNGSRRVSDDKPEAIAKACSDSDYVIDVRTINWSFVYFPVNWATYRVIYSAQLRLIDCKSGQVIAQGFHVRVPEKTNDSPSHDDLVHNKAARLKKELRVSAQEALYHFQTKILNL